MNGRVYDPIVGRFLSPDPYVQLPRYPNSYNRYTYALNNPLIFTDPSGYSMLHAILDDEARMGSSGGSAAWYYDYMNTGAGSGNFLFNPRFTDSNGGYVQNGQYHNPTLGVKQKVYYDFARRKYYYKNFEGSKTYWQDGEIYVKPTWSPNTYLDASGNWQVVDDPTSNSGDGGRALSVADDMLFHFSLTSSFISGVAESVKELSPVAKRTFGRTSKTLGAIDLAITIQLARADGMTTWGESAQIGVNTMIYLGTYNQYTLLPSIGLGIAEEYGAFDNWYSDWDEAHTLYNNYGVTILSITNPFTHTPIIINRRR